MKKREEEEEEEEWEVGLEKKEKRRVFSGMTVC